MLPPGVVVVATSGDLAAALYPVEEDAVRNAVEKRRREFTTGRALARSALGRLGLPEGAIPSEADGAPGWPAGIVGSITHCAGCRACAVAAAEIVAGVGIDAEPNRPIAPSVRSLIAGPGESLRLDRLARADPGVSWARLLFSIKEAIYKAWWPLTARPLGFRDADEVIDPDRGTFRARLPAGGTGSPGGSAVPVEGRWAAADGLLLATASFPPDGRGPGAPRSGI
jgi:4'-phosphopantetheinyl transferase EntD